MPLRKDGRWRSALAELTIIVVGILLALWVDALREDRIDRKTERQYLESFLLDLERDLAELDSATTWTLRHGHAAEEVQLFLGAVEGPASPDTLVKSIALAGWQYLPPFSTLTIDELRSTGNLQLLRNVELRRSIGEYYNLIETVLPVAEDLRQCVWGDYDRWVKRFLSADVRTSVNVEMLGPIPGFDASMVLLPDTSEIRGALSAVPGLRETLEEVVFASRVQRNIWTVLAESAEGLREEINNELR
jgi:hypothetical protein